MKRLSDLLRAAVSQFAAPEGESVIDAVSGEAERRDTDRSPPPEDVIDVPGETVDETAVCTACGSKGAHAADCPFYRGRPRGRLHD